MTYSRPTTVSLLDAIPSSNPAAPPPKGGVEHSGTGMNAGTFLAQLPRWFDPWIPYAGMEAKPPLKIAFSRYLGLCLNAQRWEGGLALRRETAKWVLGEQCRCFFGSAGRRPKIGLLHPLPRAPPPPAASRMPVCQVDGSELYDMCGSWYTQDVDAESLVIVTESGLRYARDVAGGGGSVLGICKVVCNVL